MCVKDATMCAKDATPVRQGRGHLRQGRGHVHQGRWHVRQQVIECFVLFFQEKKPPYAVRAQEILSRPHVTLDALHEGIDTVRALTTPHPAEVLEQVEIQVKYEGYIAKEQDMADRLGKLDHLVIPDDLDFTRLTSLSYEGRQKLTDRRPRTLGEASRISGVSPSDLSVLMVYLGR